ncbi:LysR family transcriptional regulator [Streptomyces sp. NPDC059690]|uniref:helix-turn-helix domain-containing protein n=1 Tax=Streptomyces sp. NPDC059690 TaxID=3346907 RepID=UPI0036913F9B
MTRAAEEAGPTRPALSRAVGHLEQEVGAELFEQVRRALRRGAVSVAPHDTDIPLVP